MESYVSKEGLAKMLEIKPATVDYLRRKKGMPCVQVGRQFRYIFDEVHQWLRNKKGN